MDATAVPDCVNLQFFSRFEVVMQAAARQCGFHLKVYDRLLSGLDDRHLALEPAPGLKTAGWLLGHMIMPAVRAASDGPNASSELLAVPNPYESARAAFPTSGDFVGYLLTGHMSYHLGQLSGWRAAARGSLP
jgi:hypothetical protein